MTYFEKKANEIYNKIHDSKIDKRNVTIEELTTIIELSLREVARDQRYKCIDRILERNNQVDNSHICSIVHNSYLE